MIKMLIENKRLFIVDKNNIKICEMIGTEKMLWAHSICHAVNKVTEEYLQELDNG